MKNLITNFAADESGAITVDYVVLTAAIVLFGAVAVLAITPATETLGNQIGDDLASQLD